jgi:hypothetical protein
MSENLEKVIPICKKTVASANEILKGCGLVFRIYFDECEGLLSCSPVRRGLAICGWKERKDGRYDKIFHFEVGSAGILALRAAVSTIDVGIGAKEE